MAYGAADDLGTTATRQTLSAFLQSGHSSSVSPMSALRQKRTFVSPERCFLGRRAPVVGSLTISSAWCCCWGCTFGRILNQQRCKQKRPPKEPSV